MKILKTGRKTAEKAEKITVVDHTCGNQSSKQYYQIRWKEVYEFSAEIEAHSYEDALRQARFICDKSAMLTDLTEWRCGDDEDIAYSTTSEGHEIEALFDSQGIVECLPSRDESEDKLDYTYYFL